MKKTNRKKNTPQKESYPHFRWYHKSKHPALITGEHEEDEYNFHKVTHDPKEGRQNNYHITPNPDPKYKRPMYIVRRQRHDKKKYFGNRLPWKYPKK